MNELAKGLIGMVLSRFKKKNLNPVESPSTAIAYTGVAAMASLQTFPLTEYDALIQLAIGAISAYCFYTKKN